MKKKTKLRARRAGEIRKKPRLERGNRDRSSPTAGCWNPLALNNQLLREILLLALRTAVIGGTANLLQSRLGGEELPSAPATAKLLREGVCRPLECQIRLANSILEKLNRCNQTRTTGRPDRA